MKKSKISLLIFSLIIILTGIFFSVNKVEAAKSEPVTFTPQVTIPKSNFEAGVEYEIDQSTQTIGNYIKSIYNYLLAIVGLLAAIVLMASGIIWMTAAGNTERISSAKSWMTGSLTGLVLMLLSYVLLKTINPNLVTFKATDIQGLAKSEKGCCNLVNNKDLTGMFTGSSNTSMTITTEPLSCYSLALELNEPGVKKIEDLNKEEKDDIQKYMEDLGKFKPNHISLEYTTCQKIGTCIRDIALLGISGGNHVLCTPSISSECSGTLKENTDCKQPAKYYYDLLGLPDPTSNPSLYKMSRVFCLKEGAECVYDDGDDVDETYCYDGNCWVGKGKLGAPCGNDGGICVPKGHSCNDYPGRSGRERGAGGRPCESSLKCCY